MAPVPASGPVLGSDRVASTDGVTLALHDLGGSGPPLLVVHATGFCGRAYELLAAPLAVRHHVLALDLRGHGDSTAPVNGNFSWDALAADVLAAVDHLGVRSLVAFGHSVGGATVLLAELGRPGTVSAAYLYEPIVWPVGFAHAGPNPMAGPARRRREEFGSRAEALARYAARPPLGLMRADALWSYVAHGFEELADGSVRLKCRAESEAATFEAETAMTLDRVVGVTPPVTVAVGDRRPPGAPDSGPAQLAPELVARLATGRLLRYPHLGHFGPFQDPETVAADVLVALGDE
jgi:pimeloyl-ACP methyl ester carboxylesterase